MRKTNTGHRDKAYGVVEIISTCVLIGLKCSPATCRRSCGLGCGVHTRVSRFLQSSTQQALICALDAVAHLFASQPVGEDALHRLDTWCEILHRKLPVCVGL